MSDEDNTKMYIGLAVLVVAIGYYYMFMMTPSGNIISSNSYVLQNAKNGGCLTHSSNGAGTGPIEDWQGPHFCDSKFDEFSTQAKWKLIEHPTIKGSYVLQNAKNAGCLTHTNNGAGTGPIEDLSGSQYCDPKSSQFSSQALWKLIEHPTIKGSYVLQNAKNGGCLTHEGYGKGPIVDLLGSKYCDPNSSQFSKYSLWKFTQT